ncbi:MAG: hypothetical protein IPJ66_13960 [Bacteroidetes bacterium]|nr:hypothetical protein [Bacteroidota bacterium]MBL0065566.1 hypothetical protein [Bacteroidota bacterium]MBL0140418.1 hypothetical protein [Bacteroidota bacterium]
MAKRNYSHRLNFIPAIVLVCFSLYFTSCSKEEIQPESSESSVTSDIREAPIQLNNQVLPELFGFITHPSYLTIGNTTSENNLLDYLRNKGGNMVNCYARNSMTTAAGRSQFAAFCRKAITTYGVKLITCDIRETTEIATWDALYTSYPDLRAVVAPLTEKEPWVTNDYAGCFTLLRLTKAMCNRYGAKFYFYEGWMGKNYSNPQRAVDSMVYYCDGIFLSNYVSQTDYLSTASGYGKWDNRIKFRIDQGTSAYGGITVAAKKFNKLDYPLIELQSLEPSFLFNIYSTTGSYRSFYGSLYNDAKALYNLSSADVLKYTELRGKSLFYQKYVLLAQPN